jgi:glutamine synthetase
MVDFEIEAYKLGIPVKTRHNEVAPNQFECAPIFEEANLAVDHNQILMTLMDKVARRHNFRVLFHEKPFKGINGSGKHNNWSMATNTGKNLLSPGKTPRSNLRFLTFLINTIMAVHDYADILRASVAVAGNEYRLGAHEAPPAIMSVFIGSQLSSMLDQLEERVTSKKMTPDEKTELKLDIGKIPEILLDNTDRNRTSPFAFTGNRFEFRAVGSSANVAAPMITLNTVVANQLIKFKKEVDALIKKKIKKDEAIFQVLKKYIIASKKIRFEGNGYGEEWVKEAKKRGLSNIADVPEALKAFVNEHTKDVFEKSQILTGRELEARYEIRLEIYTKKSQIEARVLGDLIRNHIIPTLIKYQNVLIENVRGIKELYPRDIYEKMAEPQLKTITEISERFAIIKEAVDEMIEARKKANKIDNIREKSADYSNNVVPYFEKIRYHVDKLELIVDDEIWPFPKYREMLFTH